jgi:biotin transport system substrate-specific component
MPTMHAATSPRILPASLAETLSRKASIAIGASLFVAVSAHFSVPLPFTPVPLTLGNLAVLLVGLALEPATAFAALALYLGEGASGLPVFSEFGPGGMAQLLGPTGGYLFAYPLAAASASFLARSLRTRLRSVAAAAVACTAATAIIMSLGTLWLGIELHLAPSTALTLALVPFLPGEVVKIVAASGIQSTGIFHLPGSHKR